MAKQRLVNVLDIWFWQLLVSPHMAHLAVALARLGCKVTYVAEQAMSPDRAAQGWVAPDVPGVTLEWVRSAAPVTQLVGTAAPQSIHFCQGLRANGVVSVAQAALSARRLRQWVVMETVADTGWRGVVKRLEYRRLFLARRSALQGVLTTGHRTKDWVIARGVPAHRVFPFAYFLPEQVKPAAKVKRRLGPFRFMFAGRLISLKRVDWLVNALSGLTAMPFELWVVGAGIEEAKLKTLAEGRLGDRVRWIGQLPLPDVPAMLAQADCLVLPSVRDGWGAVASEALMVGTPVICSDACGVAGVVQASAAGGVFPVHDRGALARLLAEQIARGAVTEQARDQLAAWATCLGAAAGAAYLQQILTFESTSLGSRPLVPWFKEVSPCLD